MLRYPGGSVAVVVTEVSEHQKRFSAFDDDKKNTCILGIDENGVGFCQCSKRKSKGKPGIRISLTKFGAIVTDEDGNIQYEWKWNRQSRDAGIQPLSPIIVELNDHLTFKLKDRDDMSLEYKFESTYRKFDVGFKQKREGTYLDNAQKSNGRLFPTIDYTSLKQREDQFNEEMRAQRNKVRILLSIIFIYLIFTLLFF